VKRFQLTFVTLLIASSFIAAQKSMEERHFEYGKKLFDEQFFSLAALQFQNYLEQFPSGPHTADALFMMGKAWFLGKDFEQAQKAWLQFVIQFPSNDQCAEGHYGIAESYEKTGDFQSAITGFERIITYFPGHEVALRGLYRAAQLAVWIRDYKLGESIINRLLIEKLPLELQSRSRFLLASLYTEQNRFEKAVDILTPFTDSGIRPVDRDRARFELARNHQRMGHFEACQPLYRQVIQSASDDSLKQAARFELASTLFRLNQLTEASTLVKTILSSAIQIPPSPVYELDGAILMADHRPEDAILSLEKAVENAVPESPDLNWSLLLAYRAAGRHQSVVERTTEWLEKGPIRESVKKHLLLIRADSFLAREQDQESLKSYRDYLDLFPEDSLVPFILMKQADIYFRLGIAPVGRSVLREIWERYPESETGLAALRKCAESFESAGDWQGAVQIRQIESEQYPAGPVYPFKPVSTSKKVKINYSEMRQMHVLLSRTIQQPDNPEYAFEYGRYLVDELLLYEEAIPYLHYSFASGAYPSSAYFLGLAYFQISKRQSQHAFRDSALVYLTCLDHSTADDKMKTEALILYHAISDEDEPVRIKKLKLALGQLSSPEQQNRLRKIITAYYIQNDSLALAEQIVSDWLRVSPDEGRTDARYYAAQVYLKGNRLQKADSMFAEITNAPPFYHSRILFERAKIAYQQNESSAALDRFLEVRKQVPYLSLADTSRFFIAQLYLIRHQYKEAAEQFLKIVERDSLNRCAYETGLISHPPQGEAGPLIGLAKAFEGLENYEKARQLYNRAHSTVFFDDREDFALQMAGIAEKQGFILRAIDYLEPAMKDPTDSLFLWVGRLYEKSGQYDKVYEWYQNALKKTKDADLQMVFNQKIILALLRQDRIPEAEARINVFEKSFKKTNAFESNMAEIWLETGKAQFRLKNFALAEECFKRVRDKFKKTSFRAQAQLEIGRTYIITNKTEEALDILTKMAEEYRGDRVYYAVYLNLGDLYFRQQQLDHALTAFKTVLDDESSRSNRQLATRYLIRIYETMGLYEAALAITRSYIQQFPEADDILLKRVQIGNYYMRLNDYYRAIDQFQQVQLEADPELEAEIQYWIGKCYAEMGQSERAILEYLRVKYISKPTKLPWASTAMYEAAMLYLKMNKSWEARAIFEKIVRYEGATSDLGRVAKQRIDEIDDKLAEDR
jgi:tetratricopeptide (TPR) repeat protein